MLHSFLATRQVAHSVVQLWYRYLAPTSGVGAYMSFASI